MDMAGMVPGAAPAGGLDLITLLGEAITQQLLEHAMMKQGMAQEEQGESPLLGMLGAPQQAPAGMPMGGGYG